jgi:hypothetical protein
LREGVRKLKEELTISQRLEWIRKGLNAGTMTNGAERLQRGLASAAAPSGTNFDLRVEKQRDSEVLVSDGHARELASPARSTAATNSGSIGATGQSLLPLRNADTARPSAPSPDRDFLTQELQRLQQEKAALERQFNDLLALREQVRKLKEELTVSRRLEWIRKGLNAGTMTNGARRLVEGLREYPLTDTKSGSHPSRLVPGEPPGPAEADQAKQGSELCCYSIRVAQQRVQEAFRSGLSFRVPGTELWTIAHIVEAETLVVDEQSEDILLVGRTGSRGTLTLDDLVVALRAADGGQYPAAHLSLPSSDRPGFRSVQFVGGVEDTHLGKALLEGMQALHRLALGIDQPAHDSFKSYVQLAIEAGCVGGVPAVELSPCFKITATSPAFSMERSPPQVIHLERCALEVATEPANEAKAVGTPPSPAELAAEHFARLLTANFSQVVETNEDLARLQGLFRLFALANALKYQHKDMPCLDYFLRRYVPEKVPTPREVPDWRVERDTSRGKLIVWIR